MNNSERKLPVRLSQFIVAVAGKLTGEQLRECMRIRIGHALVGEAEPVELDFHQRDTVSWIMADDTMAEFYGYERSQGLEKLQEAQRACRFALERLIRDGEFDLAGYIASARSSLASLAKAYERSVDEAKAAIEAAHPVPNGPDKKP